MHNKLLSTIFGEYNFDNYSVVNALIPHDNDITFTEIHEFVHTQLTASTTYGTFVMMLKKINQIDDSKKELLLELIKKMTKAQETIATFIEYYSIKYLKGESEYNTSIRNLRKLNPKYFKYIEKALFFNDKTKEETLKIINLMRFIGLNALNTDIITMSVGAFQSKSRLSDYLNSNEYSILYCPDRRLKLILKKLKEELKKVSTVDNIDLDEIFGVVPIYNETLNQLVLTNICEFLEHIFEGSSKIKEIKTTLKSMKLADSHNSLGLLSVYPTVLNKTYNIPQNAISSNYPDVKSFASKYDSSALIILVSSNIFKEEYCGIIYSKLSSGPLLLTYTLEENIGDFLNNVKIPLLILGHRIIERISLMSHCPENAYVFLDSAFNMNLNCINDYCENSYYRIIEYDNFSVMIIKNSKLSFIQPISKSVFQEINRMINNKSLRLNNNIKIDEEGFDDYVIRNQTDVDKVDLILNTLFFHINNGD